MISQSNAPRSNLSDTAKEVSPHLQAIHEALRRALQSLREEVGEVQEFRKGESLVYLANRIIRGEASEKERIDFKIYLASVKSEILSDKGLSERGKMIRRNYIDKLEGAVLGVE